MKHNMILHSTSQRKARCRVRQGSYISTETAHTASDSTCWESTIMQIFFFLHTVCSFLLTSSLDINLKEKMWLSFGGILIISFFRLLADDASVQISYNVTLAAHLVQLMAWGQLLYLLSSQLWMFSLSRNGLLNRGGSALWRAVGCIWMLITCSIKFEGRSWRAKNVVEGSAMYFSCCRIHRGKELWLYGSG